MRRTLGWLYWTKCWALGTIKYSPPMSEKSKQRSGRARAAIKGRRSVSLVASIFQAALWDAYLPFLCVWRLQCLFGARVSSWCYSFEFFLTSSIDLFSSSLKIQQSPSWMRLMHECTWCRKDSLHEKLSHKIGGFSFEPS